MQSEYHLLHTEFKHFPFLANSNSISLTAFFSEEENKNHLKQQDVSDVTEIKTRQYVKIFKTITLRHQYLTFL